MLTQQHEDLCARRG